jgi:CheY-like chemotaxis protein
MGVRLKAEKVFEEGRILQPGMTGIELLTTLRESGVILPTLVMSGYYSAEDFAKWLAEGLILPTAKFLFLKKPFQFDEMLTWLGIAQKGHRIGV